MPNRIVKLVMEDGSSFDYKEKTINHFLEQEKSKAWAERWFDKQHEEWEKLALSKFSLDIEEYAKNEYDLIDSEDQKDIDDFDDEDILEEASYRGILPVIANVENSNILNEGFIDRFVNIINRGDTSDIESALSFLEFKYKIS